MSTHQNYRPVLRQLLEALVKHPDFAGIKEKFDKDLLAPAAFEACEILTKQSRIREQAQKGDAAMKLYLEMFPTPKQSDEEFDPVLGMYLAGGGVQSEEMSAAEDLIRIPETGQGSKRDADNPFFIIPSESGDFDDDDFSVITFD